MKLFSISTMLLLTAAAFWGCTANDDEPSPPEQNTQVSITASKLGGDIIYLKDDADDEEETTRSLFLGGQTGSRFAKMWDDYDVAQVYKDNVYVGSLIPNSTGGLWSTLSGTLTGSYNVGDELTIYMPSPNVNYIGQNGTIGNMSRYYDFMVTKAHVASVNGNVITTDEIGFESRQCYVQYKFKDENSKFLHIKQFIISAESGLLVAERAMDGTTTYTSSLTINTVVESTSLNDYPTEAWVAFMNDYPGKDNLTYTIRTTDDKIYKAKSVHSFQTVVGKVTAARRTFVCATVDVTPDTSITPPESDEPEVNDLTL